VPAETSRSDGETDQIPGFPALKETFSWQKKGVLGEKKFNRSSKSSVIKFKTNRDDMIVEENRMKKTGFFALQFFVLSILLIVSSHGVFGENRPSDVVSLEKWLNEQSSAQQVRGGKSESAGGSNPAEELIKALSPQTVSGDEETETESPNSTSTNPLAEIFKPLSSNRKPTGPKVWPFPGDPPPGWVSPGSSTNTGTTSPQPSSPTTPPATPDPSAQPTPTPSGTLEELKAELQTKYGIEAVDGSGATWSEGQLKAALEVLQKLPPEFYGATKRIQRDASYNGNPNVMGWVQMGDPTVHLTNSACTDVTAFSGVLVHEMTHTFQAANPGVRAQWEAQFWPNGQQKSSSVSSYGNSQAVEDMAESVRFYFQNGAQMKSQYPDRYEFIRKNVMNGVEF